MSPLNGLYPLGIIWLTDFCVSEISPVPHAGHDSLIICLAVGPEGCSLLIIPGNRGLSPPATCFQLEPCLHPACVLDWSCAPATCRSGDYNLEGGFEHARMPHLLLAPQLGTLCFLTCQVSLHLLYSPRAHQPAPLGPVRGHCLCNQRAQ